jgi:tetratricopeptide (TPR) repeat protein
LEAPARPRRAAPAERRAPEPADAATEAQLLAGALARLRGAHDPRGAVALLDQYAKAYPRGVLATEAQSARLEAALALDDRQTALKLLDGRASFAGRLGAEQLLTRAELRASAGRYADALADFDNVLVGAGAPAADAERALYGRAVTLGHLGRADRARADLVAYQQRFPGGKHAGEVARLLKGAEKRP